MMKLTKEQKYDELIKAASYITKNTALTHEQATNNLSGVAGMFPEIFPVSDEFIKMREEGIICDIFEGYTPYSPRYILPDYKKVLENGSEFLRLKPATNLEEALMNLLVIYRHVPSVTHYPVYLGNADKLLEPFLDGVSEERAKYLIERWLFAISRLIPDSYCHMNLGPEVTRAGHYILDAEIEHKEAIPSITLLYDEEITDDEFAEKALYCSQLCAKPSFANDKVYKRLTRFNYGIASCYNALPIGGGAFTLSRVMISRLAEKANSLEEFFDELLPSATKVLLDFMEAKITYLVEESHFFKSNYLVHEGLISADNFTAMVGIVGLNECVNRLLELANADEHYAQGKKADELSHRVLSVLTEIIKGFKSKYMPISNHNFLLHAQVGIAEDIGITPGIRIAIGEEPDLYTQLRHQAKFENFFPSGVGDIYPFDQTAKNNVSGILDIVKGAFMIGMQYFSTYCEDCDVVRVTGYLVKKSDLEKLDKKENVGQANSTWGYYAAKNQHALERSTKRL